MSSLSPEDQEETRQVLKMLKDQGFGDFTLVDSHACYAAPSPDDSLDGDGRSMILDSPPTSPRFTMPRISEETLQQLHKIAADEKARLGLADSDSRWIIVGLNGVCEVGAQTALEEKYFDKKGPFLVKQISDIQSR